MKKIISIALLASVMCLGACDKKGKDGEGGGGGGEKMSCDSLAKKNKKCADDIAAVFMAKMGSKVPEKMKETMVKKLKESLAGERFKKSCEKHWNSDKEKDKKTKEQLAQCFKMDDCKKYAACLKDAM